MKLDKREKSDREDCTAREGRPFAICMTAITTGVAAFAILTVLLWVEPPASYLEVFVGTALAVWAVAVATIWAVCAMLKG